MANFLQDALQLTHGYRAGVVGIVQPKDAFPRGHLVSRVTPYCSTRLVRDLCVAVYCWLAVTTHTAAGNLRRGAAPALFLGTTTGCLRFFVSEGLVVRMTEAFTTTGDVVACGSVPSRRVLGTSHLLEFAHVLRYRRSPRRTSRNVGVQSGTCSEALFRSPRPHDLSTYKSNTTTSAQTSRNYPCICTTKGAARAIASSVVYAPCGRDLAISQQFRSREIEGILQQGNIPTVCGPAAGRIPGLDPPTLSTPRQQPHGSGSRLELTLTELSGTAVPSVAEAATSRAGPCSCASSCFQGAVHYLRVAPADARCLTGYV